MKQIICLKNVGTFHKFSKLSSNERNKGILPLCKPSLGTTNLVSVPCLGLNIVYVHGYPLPLELFIIIIPFLVSLHSSEVVPGIWWSHSPSSGVTPLTAPTTIRIALAFIFHIFSRSSLRS